MSHTGSILSQMETRNYPTSHSRQRNNSMRTVPKPLKFDHAMNDFRTMFPELDFDVIETVLRANNGVVQSTIDQLLVLQETTDKEQGNVNDMLPELPSYETSTKEEPPPAYSDIWDGDGLPADELLFTPLKLPEHGEIKSFTSQSRFYKRVGLVGDLPDDFLRLGIFSPSPQQAAPLTTRYTNPSEDFMTENELERFMEDEKLAVFLQNEEFIKELRRNQEFVSAVEADHASATGSTTIPASVPSGGARPRTTPSSDDIVFKQKLRHMGKSTRKKFGKMAKKFSRSRSSQRILLNKGTSSTFNLLEEEKEESVTGNEGIAFESVQEDSETDVTETQKPATANEPVQVPQNVTRLRTRSRRLPTVPGAANGMPIVPGATNGLPTVPSATETSTTRTEGNEEPIVFYSEDNEFAFKNEQ